MTTTIDRRLIAAALAAFVAANALLLALAQLDFAGVLNVLNIDGNDSATALRLFAGASGVGSIGVAVGAATGAVQAATGASSARGILEVTAIAGFATATILWFPSAAMLGAALALLPRSEAAA